MPNHHATGRKLTSAELRAAKPSRETFRDLPRNPITVLLDGVTQNYNIGAIFRLCDAFLVERLVICGAEVDLRKRRLVQSARGTQLWTLWDQAESSASVVEGLKSKGYQIVAVELTDRSIRPEALSSSSFPVCVVLGSERDGVSQDVLERADRAVAIPMLGMGNSINVATAAAIVLNRLANICQSMTDRRERRNR